MQIRHLREFRSERGYLLAFYWHHDKDTYHVLNSSDSKPSKRSPRTARRATTRGILGQRPRGEPVRRAGGTPCPDMDFAGAGVENVVNLFAGRL